MAHSGAWVKILPGSHTCPVWWKEAGWTAPLPPALASSRTTGEFPWSWGKGIATCWERGGRLLP